MRKLILILALAVPLAAEEPAVVTGKLVKLPDKTVAVQKSGKETRLVDLISKDEYIAAVLADERLLGKELQAAGKWEEKDRRLDVEKLHTVHHDKIHRIAYYCETCNIWASTPGPCVCCMAPMELRELPVEEK